MAQSPENKERFVYKRKPRKCPVCGSKNIAKFLYGMPFPSEELDRLVEERKVILCGCIVSDDDPSWGCINCETEFYRQGGPFD